MTDRKKIIKGLTCRLECGCMNEDHCNPECPYLEDPRACYGLDEDALALLKAQEPRVRVMSLEDICESIEHDKRISVYLQQKDGICREPRPALYTNLYGEGIDLRLGIDYVDYGGWLEQIVLYTKEYLKTWCLWTSRPTDEQMEATPWND